MSAVTQTGEGRRSPTRVLIEPWLLPLVIWGAIRAINRWAFRHLPWRFTVPFFAILAGWFLLIFPQLTLWLFPLLNHSLLEAAGFIQQGMLAASPVGNILLAFINIIESVFILTFALCGTVLSYGIAGEIYYRWWRRKAIKIEPPAPTLPLLSSDEDIDETNPLYGYERIGIILSGGGAKGAYQAGAMQAIYEFLERHKAHHRVKMIAGTSIGSWNALFWLAGLIKGEEEGCGPLKSWWSKVDVETLISPVKYVPTRQNFILSNEPWRESFRSLFGGKNSVGQQVATEAGRQLLRHAENPKAKDSIHFYFTQSNVQKARLEFMTNRRNLNHVGRNLPGSKPPSTTPYDAKRGAKDLDDICTGVFSSMDLPPLFEYTPIGKDLFEDGGVIDNLPIQFGTEIEKCDLLFILPLNASFEEEDINKKSVIRRILRVMSIRQGILERNAFKMIYLYNELAGLRERVKNYEGTLLKIHHEVESLKNKVTAQDILPLVEPLTQMLRIENCLQTQSNADGHVEAQQLSDEERGYERKHKKVSVFSICPAPELIISTAEFWKTEQAALAFDHMYQATKEQLEKQFKELVSSDWVSMLLVDDKGKVECLSNF